MEESEVQERSKGVDKVSKLIDAKGLRFGKLTVIERAEDYVSPQGNRSTRWLCRCDCGNEIVTAWKTLKAGRAVSCGCAKKERFTVHSMYGTRLYKIHDHLIQRCCNPKDTAYVHYGERGITVCDDWKDFMTFYDWAMANGYQDDLTIDRIDVNGNYSPENCRWVTMKEQLNNTRRNHYLTYGVETLTVSQWAERTGMKRSTIVARIAKGWSVEKVLTEPLMRKRKR